jgi:hypothetical protein
MDQPVQHLTERDTNLPVAKVALDHPTLLF